VRTSRRNCAEERKDLAFKRLFSKVFPCHYFLMPAFYIQNYIQFPSFATFSRFRAVCASAVFLVRQRHIGKIHPPLLPHGSSWETPELAGH
jgi:hypothetical protein